MLNLEGHDFPPLKVRMDLLAEQLEIVHGHWAEGAFAFAGEHYRLDDLDARPKPVQRPHPPLLLGGKAGLRGAALAARWADEYNTPFAVLDDIVAMKDRVIAACESAGREPIPFSVMTGLLVGRDRGELRDRARLLAEHRPDVGDPDALLASTQSAWITGTVDEVAEQLGALRDAGVARVMCQQLLATDLDQVAVIGGEVAPMVA